MYQGREVITTPGTWKAPAGKKSLRIIVVGKGGDGTKGADGNFENAGADGVDGLGGLVWAGTININEGQEFQVAFGTDTTFGAYSSANGKRYNNGYTDVASGNSFARTAVAKPVPGTGDGRGRRQGRHEGAGTLRNFIQLSRQFKRDVLGR